MSNVSSDAARMESVVCDEQIADFAGRFSALIRDTKWADAQRRERLDALVQTFEELAQEMRDASNEISQLLANG